MTDAFVDLLDEPRWLAWREEETANGRSTKVPYAVTGSRKGSSTDPATWGTHDQAASRARRLDDGRKVGCGIVLGDLGRDLHIAGIDLDSSLDDSGALAGWAEQIIDVLDSYSETSPSGRGLKAFFYIEADDVRWFLDLIGVDAGMWGTKRGIPGLSGADHGPGVEIYCAGRYFTVTGQLWSTDHPRIVTLDRERLEALAVLMPAPAQTGGNGLDNSGSGKAWRAAAALGAASLDEMIEGLRKHADPVVSRWANQADGRQLQRVWERNAAARTDRPFAALPWHYPEDPWEAINLTSLQDRAVPRRHWIVDQWLPALETTGFSGSGATGKTLAAMQLATAGALGRHWFKIAVPQIKVFALLCEDRPDDVHIRQVTINRLYECDFADLENLLVYPRRSHPRNRLMIFDRDGVGHPAPFFFQLLREIPSFGAELTILDTRADLFLGNQNDEDQARTFVRLICDRIAEETGGAVLLLSHPSRAGKREGTGESGSVQWDAAFRSRWYLENKPSEDGAPSRRARILTRVKSNFAEHDETMELAWDDGVLIRTDAPAPAGFAVSARQQKAQRVFLALFDKITAQGRSLSDTKQSSRYAPKIMGRDPDREGMAVRDFETAMERLFSQNAIRIEPYGPPSKGQTTIVKVVLARP
jgi:RecA-family ATPase